MEGYNAVIFAYGQTASGKTFTLTGSPSNPGIIPLAITDLFAQIRSTPDREFLLRASYLELYNETIIDLLSTEPGRELSLSEGRKKGEVVINGLTEMAVRTEEEVRRLLKMGEDRRKVGGTDWNQRSSRSHCVFRMVRRFSVSWVIADSRSSSLGHLRTSHRHPARRERGRLGSVPCPSSVRSPGPNGDAELMIDLAGSERHTTSKERNAEGKHINQS
jgi:centromeric protein E